MIERGNMAVLAALEEAAKLAESFVGQGKRDRIAKGWKMARFQPHERDEIAAEENGGNIAATDIAAAIRALASAAGARRAETEGLGPKDARAAAESRDAPEPQP